MVRTHGMAQPISVVLGRTDTCRSERPHTYDNTFGAWDTLPQDTTMYPCIHDFLAMSVLLTSEHQLLWCMGSIATHPGFLVWARLMS